MGRGCWHHCSFISQAEPLFFFYLKLLDRFNPNYGLTEAPLGKQCVKQTSFSYIFSIMKCVLPLGRCILLSILSSSKSISEELIPSRVNALRPPLHGAGLLEHSFLWFPLLHDFGAPAAFQRPRCPLWGGLWSTNSAQGLLEETCVTVISHKIILLNATRHRLWTTMYFDECLSISGAAWGSTSICQCKEYDIK